MNIQANINGALGGGAQAVHPGFGFLSENADFAEACEKAGLIFIGPSPKATRILGDKVRCKELAKTLGLPLIPGYEGESQAVDFLLKESEKIGFPLIVKAAAGGGGRGMKVLKNLAESRELIESAQREALAAFGSSKVFLEKYLDHAKHIEFQIFGDASGRVIHLMDRECSIHRRHQKIIEESMSPSLTQELRRQMGEAAISIATQAGYKGAGTVEFLLQDGQYYFLEVNTRLQVEHPVTEMVMGVDLVKAQILTAQSEPAFSSQQMILPRGHSIECRIYAENPYLGGVPSTGVLGKVEWPEGPGRRFEYGFEDGDEITSFYASMIAKVVVWDETRVRAIQKMQRVLKDSVLFGVQTNIPYLLEILSHPEFVQGTMTTRFIENHFSEPLKQPELTAEEKEFAEKAMKTVGGFADSDVFDSKSGASPWKSYWRGV